MTALAKVQIARKETGIHEDDYRGMLERITGQRSAKGLSDAQLGLVLDEFKTRHGWKPSIVKGGKTAAPGRKPVPAEHPSAKKARALWISLWQLGVIRNKSEEGLEAFAQAQLGCERMAWADQQQMYKLVEALKAMAQRAGWSQTVRGDPKYRTHQLVRNLVELQCTKLGIARPADLNTADLGAVMGFAKAFGRAIHELGKAE